MKRIIPIVALSIISVSAFAQQDPQFSQNMFNKLYVNPAFAGASEAICLHALYRAQWVNFDGAPKTFVFGADAPLFDNKVGVGLSVSSDDIGFENTLQGKLAGAYHFQIGSGKLGVGLDVDFLQHSIDGKFIPPDGTTIIDPAIPQASVNGTAFDMGGGLYFHSEKLYIGASATHLLESQVDLDKFKKEFKRHYYGMIGYSFDLSPSLALKPSFFVKNVTDNTTMDFNLNLHINNRFWIGGSYRTEDAIVAMLGLNITDKLRLGYSYDITTSDIKTYSDGTHEIMLGYCFTTKKKIPTIIRNVRFL
jgi:type IX secretion system PorP/SprF family membrane protein